MLRRRLRVRRRSGVDAQLVHAAAIAAAVAASHAASAFGAAVASSAVAATANASASDATAAISTAANAAATLATSADPASAFAAAAHSSAAVASSAADHSVASVCRDGRRLQRRRRHGRVHGRGDRLCCGALLQQRRHVRRVDLPFEHGVDHGHRRQRGDVLRGAERVRCAGHATVRSV